MSRIKRYIDTDVVTEARARLHHVYDQFDSVIYSFSGGKDSLVCMELGHQVAMERFGPDAQIDVVFRDEELIPDDVIAFVDGYRRRPWIRMRWYAVPLVSNKFILGKHLDYVQWDPAREWMRPKPDWAITLDPPGGRPFGQHVMDELVSEGYAGKVAIVLGIRASESITRYRSVVNKLSDNYICQAHVPPGSGLRMSKRIRLAKPIFDWEEDDVMKWLHEQGIAWAPIYDAQHLAGAKLRLATPLHVEASKRFWMHRRVSPEFYGRLIELFPEMLVQERYWTQYDSGAVIERYASRGWAGVEAYIRDEMPNPRQRRLARQRLLEMRQLHQRDPEAYSAEYLVKALARGSIERVLLPDQKVAIARGKAREEAAQSA